PLTKAWFLGLANIRGNLYSVIDFAVFLGEARIALTSLSRLVLLSARGGESAGIVVERVLGLRNLAQFSPQAAGAAAPAWQVAAWRDAYGVVFSEIDLGMLA